MKTEKPFDLVQLGHDMHAAERILGQELDFPTVKLLEESWNRIYRFVDYALEKEKQQQEHRDILRMVMRDLDDKIEEVNMTSDMHDTRHVKYERQQRNALFYEMGMDGYLPKEWENYKYRLDDEWAEYARLHEKFKGVEPE